MADKLQELKDLKTFCPKCKSKTGNSDIEFYMTKNNRKAMKSRCNVCSGKKSMFLGKGFGELIANWGPKILPLAGKALGALGIGALSGFGDVIAKKISGTA